MSGKLSGVRRRGAQMHVWNGAGRHRTLNCHRLPPGRANARPMTGSSGRSSIPETSAIEPIGRGVPDAPLSRSMTAVGWGASDEACHRYSGMVRRTRPQMRNCASGNLQIPGSMRSLSSGRASRGPVASLRNDGLKRIAPLALATTSRPPFETHRCRDVPQDDVRRV